jgi:hypothetical protein
MYKNMGGVDRTVRAVVGVGGLVAAFLLPTSIVVRGVVAGVSVVMLLTSAIGVCPAYLPFKIMTCKRCAAKE